MSGKEHKAIYLRKADSRLMRAIAWFLRVTGINARFMEYWTTIGKWVWYPETVVDPYSPAWFGIREYEQWHVEQAYTLGLGLWPVGVVIMALFYVVLPLPVLCSGRWWIERGPYLQAIRCGRKGLLQAVESLHRGYWRPWPRPLMLAWFDKRLTPKQLVVASMLDVTRGYADD